MRFGRLATSVPTWFIWVAALKLASVVATTLMPKRFSSSVIPATWSCGQASFMRCIAIAAE